MSTRTFLLGFALVLMLAYGMEALLFSWDLDEGISVNHTSEWFNQWLLQKDGLLKGELIRLFTWPFIHDFNRVHFGLNLALLLGLIWFLPKISLKKLMGGLSVCWGFSSLLFLVLAPSSHYLLGSSHWIFFLWGIFWSHEKRKIRMLAVGLGFLFSIGSFANSGWISGIIHFSAFLGGIFWSLLGSSKKPFETIEEEHFPFSRLQLIQQKIQKSGFDSLLKEEQLIWKEEHGKLD